ncbi:MAG TPA: cytochrome P450, partial [Roseateles sp.]|nr:cytochrome P450 [Roseateles sp.]
RPDALDTARQADARQFRPQRWLEDSPAAGGHELLKASMPFGAGPRLCPGRYLALLEMKMVLALLARGYGLAQVACADGRAPAECLAFTMFPVGLQLRLRHRH